jgi:cyanophycinase
MEHLSVSLHVSNGEKHMTSVKPRGELIIIGGHEKKSQEETPDILQYVARRVNQQQGHLLIMTVASQEPESLGPQYQRVFGELGVRDIQILDIRSRDDAITEDAVVKVREAGLVFFTGGDQLRITSQIGDSPVYQCLAERFRKKKLTVAGTSAGAAAIPQTMLISGPGDTSDIVSGLGMAPGLGLLDGVVIDSHFAERGRFGRLLGAVAQNPRNLGVGIDEDTAIVVQTGECFEVIGSGAAYVLDGSSVSYSSLSEARPEGVMSIFNVRMHVLADRDCFDLTSRTPHVTASS